MSNGMKTREAPFLIGAVILLAAVQFVAVPTVASGVAQTYPEVDALALPYVVAVGVGILGLQAACLALYLHRSRRDQSSASRRRAIGRFFAASLVFSGLVFVAVLAHAAFVADIGGPAVTVGIILFLALIVLTPRLRQAAFAHPDPAASTHS